jgi:hypothetical protein
LDLDLCVVAVLDLQFLFPLLFLLFLAISFPSSSSSSFDE